MKRYLPLLLALSACSHAPVGDDPYEARDPIRPVNEKIFAFNVGADRYVIGPVAHTYHKLPGTLRLGADNFLTNLGEPLNAIDGILAGNPKVAFTSLWRFVLNTTFGFLGFRDFAAQDAGLKHQDWDFGQTLGRYGIPEGPYIVLPILGPSTARDTTGQVVDWFADPVNWVLTTPESIGQAAADGIDTRDGNDGIVNQLYYDSLDPYIATRSTYLQHQAFTHKPDQDFLAPKDKK